MFATLVCVGGAEEVELGGELLLEVGAGVDDGGADVDAPGRHW